MNHLSLSFFVTVAFAATSNAQTQTMLMTFSDPELSLTGSGGTVLGTLLPNEIHYVDYGTPCSAVSSEKWLPRTNAHVMAGDENANGVYFRPNIFGPIDAVMSVANWISSVGIDNQRTVFWSPSQPMGTAISALPFRPGDVGRIAPGGQVQYFMSQEQFNLSLGLPPAYPIDIDAISFQPNYGIFFSVDVDVAATTQCGPTLVQDGDVICIPPPFFNIGSGMTIASVFPNSAVVVYSEADMDAITATAQVADRWGACLTAVGDVEALDVDVFGPDITVTPCVGISVLVPNLLFASENGTGASVLETGGGGAIRDSACGLMGSGCGFGPTLGYQVGIQPFSGNIGAQSHVNALASTRVCRFVQEPVDHVMNVFPLGAPLGANTIDYHNPFPFAVSLIEIVPPVIPASVPAFPFSPLCFPDLYAPSVTIWWWPLGPGFGSYPMVNVPSGWTGKVLYQLVGFPATGPLELSTPTVIDVQ